MAIAPNEHEREHCHKEQDHQYTRGLGKLPVVLDGPRIVNKSSNASPDDTAKRVAMTTSAVAPTSQAP
jgi:hypothetical protein